MDGALDAALRIPWVRQGDWAGSLVFRGQIFLGLQRDVPGWTGVGQGVRAFLQAGAATWLLEGDFDAFAEAYLARVREEPRRIVELVQRFDALLVQVRSFESELRIGQPEALGRDALAAVAGKYASLDEASQPYSYVFGYGEEAIVGRLVRDIVERNGGDPRGSANVAQALLLAPADVPTDTQAAQEALLDVAEEAERAGIRTGGATTQPRALQGAIAAHVARFGYLGGSPEEVLASARVHIGRAALVRRRRHREAGEREAAWNARVKSLKLPPADRELLDVLRRQGGVRTTRRELWMRVRAAYEPYLEAMAGALSVPLDDLHLLTTGELSAALRGAPLPVLGSRRDDVALLAFQGELHVFTGSEARRLLWHAERKVVDEPSDVVTGLGASPGIVQGLVRIIKGPSEADRVLKGDVLVTDMTEPDLVLACERAAAIVTDLGGMLSHAAIVSRELGIPCVLGTGRATRVLRDGDLVQVDGEAGRVVVLKRAGGGN